jgi:TMEM175 potassium channel family protein
LRSDGLRRIPKSEDCVSKQRLEAFTDGVMAVIITIMVLDMKVPLGADFAALKSALPVFLAYALSFANVGIFWNNHHHMLHVTERINGMVLWANLFLLFWMSLVPFVIRWMDDTHFASSPTASYGVVLVLCSISYILLERTIIRCNGPGSKLARAVGWDLKSVASLVIYMLAIPLAFVRPWIALALYVVVAMTWFIPDRRIESMGQAE